MNYAKRFKPGSLQVLVCCLFVVTISCERKKDAPPYQFPDYGNTYVNTIKNKLEYPSGLSVFPDETGVKHHQGKSAGTITSGVFIEGPQFQNLRGDEGIQIARNPRLSRYEIDLDQAGAGAIPVDYLSVITIAEFDFSVYHDEFDSFSYFGSWITYGEPDSAWRASRLLLDDCVINNDSVLTSSNSSDKIFITDADGETSVFMEDEELTGITDLVYSRNGKVYAAQAPVLDQTNPQTVIRPKRLISIKNGTVSVELELPTSISPEFLKYPENLEQWLGTPCLEQVKIIENSEEGKRRFGTEFYIADLLGNRIYKVDNSNNIETLAGDLKYPTSVAVDSMGNLFYTSSPVFWLYGYITIENRETLYAINPETGATRMICEFGTSVFDEYCWHAGFGISVQYGGQRCELPLDLNITNVLYETDSSLYFLITNTRLGNICLIRLEK